MVYIALDKRDPGVNRYTYIHVHVYMYQTAEPDYYRCIRHIGATLTVSSVIIY